MDLEKAILPGLFFVTQRLIDRKASQAGKRRDEAYGAYFRKFRGESVNVSVRGIKSSYLDSLLYAEFNNVLLQKMQAAEGILDYEFQREFGDEQKTQDLQQFFDSFKFASHY